MPWKEAGRSGEEEGRGGNLHPIHLLYSIEMPDAKQAPDLIHNSTHGGYDTLVHWILA